MRLARSFRCVSGAGLADLAAPRGCYEPLTRMRWISGTGGGYYQQCCCLCTVPVRTTAACGAPTREVENALWGDTLIAVGAAAPSLIEMVRPELVRLVGTTPPGIAPSGVTSTGVKPSGMKPAGNLVWPSWPGTELLALSPMPCFFLACFC